MDKRRSIMGNSIYNFTLKVFRIIIPIFVIPYLQRLFDKDLYGSFNDASIWLDIALIFGSFGIYTYGIRELSGIRDDKEKRRRLFTSLFLFGVVTNFVCLGCYTAFVLFSAPVNRTIYLIMGLKLFANAFMVEWLNEALENYRFITLKTVVVRLVYLAGILSMIHDPDDVPTYCLIVVGTDFLNNIISFFYVQKEIPFTRKGLSFLPHIAPLCSILIISNVNVLYTMLDKMFLSWIYDDKSLITVYRTPQDITYMIAGLLSSVVLVAVPRLAYYYKNGEKEEYLTLLNKSYRSFMLLVIPACMGIACLAPEIMWLYGGGKYDDSIPVLVVFAFRTLESAVYTICANQILYIQRQEKFLVKALLIGGVLNVILKCVLALLALYTPVTAIASTLLSEIVLMVILFRYIQKELGLAVYFFTKSNLLYMGLSLVFVPIIYLVKQIDFAPVLSFVTADTANFIGHCVLAIGLSVGFYFFVLLFLLKDETAVYLWQKALGKLRSFRK